jgi:2-methylisocitrate lyase-like PEP mutase family enzyme
MRTVTELEAAGASGIILEDQVFPKKCGHFNGKEVVPVEEMVAKLRVAGLARRSEALLIVARTDALAIEGFDAALARAATYIDAGADVIFVEAPTSVDQLEAIPKMLGAPCLVNMVEGGKTPILTVDELGALGYKIVLYANLALRTAAQSVREAFVALRRDGSSEGIMPKMISWDDRQRLVRLPWWEELDRGV